MSTWNASEERALNKLDDAVTVGKNADRYLWLRDHCTYDELMALVALVRSHAEVQSRSSVLDAAIDAEIVKGVADKSCC